MVTLSFTIFSRQKNHNRAHMLFQYLSGFEPILYTTHTNEEPKMLVFTFEDDEKEIMNYIISLASIGAKTVQVA